MCRCNVYACVNILFARVCVCVSMDHIHIHTHTHKRVHVSVWVCGFLCECVRVCV